MRDGSYWNNVKRYCEEFEFNFPKGILPNSFGPSYMEDYAYTLWTSYQQRRVKRPFLRGGELRRYSRIDLVTQTVMMDSFLFAPEIDAVGMRTIVLAVDPLENQVFHSKNIEEYLDTPEIKEDWVYEEFLRSLGDAAMRGSTIAPA